jgi:hypothetical protein
MSCCPVSVAAVRQAISEYDYSHYGLRVLEDLPDDAETIGPSRRWDDNDPTDEYLEGTSVIAVDGHTIEKALKLATSYYGRYVVLVGSDAHAGYGEDEGEILLEDPIVLERWTKPSPR